MGSSAPPPGGCTVLFAHGDTHANLVPPPTPANQNDLSGLFGPHAYWCGPFLLPLHEPSAKGLGLRIVELYETVGNAFLL